MISITKLTLENFQSHKYTVIDFESGLNSIIGSTDSGKTAIFRALKWALYNEPAGDYFLRTGEDYVSVKIEFSNGNSIRRYRKKNKNFYEVTDSSGKTQEFSGFNRSVPVEVTDASKVTKINFTPSEGRFMNMAEQLDPPFLLAESPNLKAAAIGKLVGSDIIDAALSGTVTDLNARKRENKSLDENLDRINTELKKFEYLEDLRDTIDKIENVQSKIKDKTNDLIYLESYLSKYESLKNSISVTQNTINSLNYIDDMERLYSRLSETYLRLQRIENLSVGLDGVKNKIASLDTAVKSLSSIERASNIGAKISSSLSDLIKYESLSDRHTKITKNKSILELMEKRLSVVPSISNIKTQLEDKIGKDSKLVSLTKELIKVQERIKNGNYYIKKFDNMGRVQSIYNELETKNRFLHEYENIINKWSVNNKKIYDLNKKHEEIINSQNKISEEYREVFSKMKICPTCFRPIDMHDTEDILKHLGGD